MRADEARLRARRGIAYEIFWSPRNWRSLWCCWWAGLLIKGFSRLRSMNPGFNPANVMTMYLQLPATRYGEIPKRTQFRRELLARLNALPGLQAAMVSDIPLGGNYVDHGFVIDGHPPVAVGGETDVQPSR